MNYNLCVSVTLWPVIDVLRFVVIRRRLQPRGGLEVGRSNQTAMQRRGKENAIAPDVGEPHEVGRAVNAAAGKQGDPWNSSANPDDRFDVGSRAHTHSSQIEHDNRFGACLDRPRGYTIGRLSVAIDSNNRLAMTQVEAEHDAAAEHVTHCLERGVRTKRFEADNHMLDAARKKPTRPIDGRNTGIHVETHPEPYQRADEQLLRRTLHNRVEVGRVELRQPEAICIRARQRQRIAVDRTTGHGTYGHILIADTAARMDCTAGPQVHHADYPHNSTCLLIRTRT
jgi:hypothetical protein